MAGPVLTRGRDNLVTLDCTDNGKAPPWFPGITAAAVAVETGDGIALTPLISQTLNRTGTDLAAGTLVVLLRSADTAGVRAGAVRLRLDVTRADGLVVTFPLIDATIQVVSGA